MKGIKELFHKKDEDNRRGNSSKKMQTGKQIGQVKIAPTDQRKLIILGYSAGNTKADKSDQRSPGRLGNGSRSWL